MSETDIEWTDMSWNPVTGCTKVSRGCQNCYAEPIAYRHQRKGTEKYRNGFELTVHREYMSEPLTWQKPRRVFVCSMSDLFHEEVSDDFIFEVSQVMREARWHDFQVLTKRPERLETLNPVIHWPENVWMGVTVEDAAYLDRLQPLKSCEAAVKFISFEPLLGPIPEPNLEGIDWVIVGGESGPSARAMEKQWALDLRDVCLDRGIPFFFKQWGGKHKKEGGRLLEGREWNQFPILPRRGAERRAPIQEAGT